MLGLVFPGQGSQNPGMGRFLYDHFPIAKHRIEEASDHLGLSMLDLLFSSSDEELAQTANTQPALLTISVATWDAIKLEFGVNIQVSAGHSIGEYAAMVVAGAIQFADAVKAVRARGIAMQEAVPAGKGGMLAVLGLSDEQVLALCEWANREFKEGQISPANFNSPGQVVISGHANAIAWVKENFRMDVIPGESKRVKFIPLQVSAPFHCPLMLPAEKRMREVLAGIPFQDSAYPIVQNFHAQKEHKADLLRENLIRQVSAPVLWTQCVLKMKGMGASMLIECGHGKVLAGLVKKIDPSIQVVGAQSLDEFKNIPTALQL